jgi:uncharacterized protein (TIGR02569 family)
VLAAFGVAGCAVTRLAGGQGTSWHAGGAVFKPAGQDAAEMEWLAAVYSQARGAGFRIARQRRAVNGAVCVDGWCATDFVAGEHASRRWADAIRAGERLHAALAGLPRPAFLDRRESPWVTGDRVAWGEIPVAQFAHVRHVHRLAAAIRPVTAPSQLIHGDLGGNVLYHDVLPPAVIDFSPYWRPAAFAAAIVVADALVWEGADRSILAAVRHIGDFGQYLLRALIYRAVTESILGKPDPDPAGSCQDPYAPAVDLACKLVIGSVDV